MLKSTDKNRILNNKGYDYIEGINCLIKTTLLRIKRRVIYFILIFFCIIRVMTLSIY